MSFGVLVAAMFGLVLTDRVAPLQLGVDVGLLRYRVGCMEGGERMAHLVAVSRAGPQIPQQGFEAPVVFEDELDDVTVGGPSKID